ncbi:MAG: thiamine phosphate synthase, partial [Rhizobiales bacterium]|nr:thiamine phosphate synthase [Hyphomicrobiales bacterium]
MPAQTPDRCRLVLITPPGIDPAALERKLSAALAAGDVASLILPRYDLDDAAFQALCERLVPLAQERGVAAIVAGDTRVAGRVGADGIHVEEGKAGLANYAAAGLCFLAVPVLMGSQEWDDHDRSKKTLARDLARDYLESCPPNAILFSFGDNDTYPLWYAQEVEGIRPDVRVMVNTLLGTDWYMNELRYKVNESAPFDIIFTPEQIMGDKRNVSYFVNDVPGYDKSKYYDLYSVLKNVTGSDEPAFTRQAGNGNTVNLVPTHKFSVPVDLNTVRTNGTVHEGDSVVSELHLDIPEQRNFLVKNDLAILAIIAANKWNRPICFTSPQELGDLGLSKYVRLRGLSYQLVPVLNGNVDNDVAYKTIMEKFTYGNASTPGVYYDEENRRHLNSIKFAHAQIAMSLVDAGKKDSARKVLEHFDQNVLESNFPYGMTSN